MHRENSKRILSILALILIMALTLTGCGKKDDQNAAPTAAPDAANNGGNAFADLLANANTTGSTGNAGSVTVSDLSITPGLDANWRNILLLGADARAGMTQARTDTMIICSINNSSGQVKLTSLMRDTAVSIAGHGTNRLNSAFYFGGANLAMKTINEYFGMNIQEYVYVDFSGFAVIAEALGGVTMDITESEMTHINNNVIEQYIVEIKAGRRVYEEAEAEYYATMLKEFGAGIKLNGMQTLGYARIRKLDSDYARTERQRKVLNAMMNNLKGTSYTALLGHAVNLMPYVTTNLKIEDILSVANAVLNSANFTDAAQLRLPKQGTYKEETRNEESMLYDMDKTANKTELYNFIYGY